MWTRGGHVEISAHAGVQGVDQISLQELTRSERHTITALIDQFVPRARVGRPVNRIIAISSGMGAKEISKAFSLTRPLTRLPEPVRSESEERGLRNPRHRDPLLLATISSLAGVN